MANLTKPTWGVKKGERGHRAIWIAQGAGIRLAICDIRKAVEIQSHTSLTRGLALHHSDGDFAHGLQPRRNLMASITYDEAAHLLRRMGFGGPPEEINALVALG